MNQVKAKSKPSLIFVDTNILLDFYRQSGESAVRQINALERHKDSLILTDQVWMEFLKNRQKVILETMKGLRKPDGISFAPFLSEYQHAKTVSASLKTASQSFKKVEEKVERIIASPSYHDDVYKGLARIFSHKSQYYLKREDKIRLRIRNLARKRFTLGYPPRKSGDTSIGDAVNWEWIIHCAKESDDKRNILLISRDTDYGMSIKKDAFLNDWLVKEFKERVSRRRKIELSAKLTYALKRLDEQVTKNDEKEEDAIIATFNTRGMMQSPLGLDELKRTYLLNTESFSIDDTEG